MNWNALELIYLAAPFNHPDVRIRDWRYEVVTRVARDLLAQGYAVFSPITHNIPIDRLSTRGNWDTWRDQDFTLLKRCDRLLVLKLDGYQESIGVAAEIAFAKSYSIPIEEIEVDVAILEEVEAPFQHASNCTAKP